MAKPSNIYINRDQLIQHIKDVGQELIDKADEIVGKNIEYISDYRIEVDIPVSIDEVPTITWSANTFSRRVIDRMNGLIDDEHSEYIAPILNFLKDLMKSPIEEIVEIDGEVLHVRKGEE